MSSNDLEFIKQMIDDEVTKSPAEMRLEGLKYLHREVIMMFEKFLNTPGYKEKETILMHLVAINAHVYNLIQKHYE